MCVNQLLKNDSYVVIQLGGRRHNHYYRFGMLWISPHRSELPTQGEAAKYRHTYRSVPDHFINTSFKLTIHALFSTILHKVSITNTASDPHFDLKTFLLNIACPKNSASSIQHIHDTLVIAASAIHYQLLAYTCGNFASYRSRDQDDTRQEH